MSLVEANQAVLFVFDKNSTHTATIRGELEATATQGVFEAVEVQDAAKLASSSESKFDVIVTLSDSAAYLTQALLMDLWKLLKPQGSLKLLEPFDRTFEHSSGLTSSLTLSGFTNQTTSSHANIVLVSAQKPNYAAGASQAIKLKKKPVADAWSAASTGNEPLIDESSLLSAADLAKPTLVDDCEVGATKKACKNCTCGRAEAEAEDSRPKVTLAMLENPAVNSSCGSCSLGDAFRCGGCPYRGLPAFKPGEKIVLPDDFDMDLVEV